MNNEFSAAEVFDMWSDPKPLPTGLPLVSSLEPQVLPEPLAPWIQDVATRMQAPIEFVAVPAMVAAGAVIGRKVGIRPQRNTDWYEVPNLWGCVVGRPGVMKSPAVQAALKPISQLQALAREDHSSRMADFSAFEVEREMRADARKAAIKKRLKDNPDADLGGLAVADEEPPTLRRYTVNDSSYQSLGELLIQNQNGLLVHRDELLSLLRSLDREENVEARGFYLSGWNGTESYTFDRIVRGTNLHVPSVTVSMIGSTQPGRLRDYASAAIEGTAGDDGMLQRFGLLVWPDTSPNWVEYDCNPDPVARSSAFRTFEQLDRLTAESVGGQVDEHDQARPYLRFDDEGLERFRQWRTDHEARLRQGELHPAVESHLAKYRKLIPTLALVHHLASGWSGPVGDVSVLSALAWGEFLETHAHRVYSAALNRSPEGAREIIRRLRSGALPPKFSARDVYRNQWSGLTNNERTEDALKLLEENLWVRSTAVPPGPRGGPGATVYTANPKGLRR